MSRGHRWSQRLSWIVGAAVGSGALLLMSGVVPAAGPGIAGLTEAGGGVPATRKTPPTAVRIYDPETTTVFTDQGDFLAAVLCETVTLESFEELAATNQTNVSTIAVAGFTMSTDSPPRLGVWNQRFQGAFATDGSQWIGVEENQLIVPQVTTLTFRVPINHFGVNLTDYGDFGGGNLEFANDVGDVATAAFSGSPSGNQQFFGFINTARAFTRVTLTHSIQGEFFGLDEITYCWRGRPDAPANRRSSSRVVPD